MGFSLALELVTLNDLERRLCVVYYECELCDWPRISSLCCLRQGSYFLLWFSSLSAEIVMGG